MMMQQKINQSLSHYERGGKPTLQVPILHYMYQFYTTAAIRVTFRHHCWMLSRYNQYNFSSPFRPESGSCPYWHYFVHFKLTQIKNSAASTKSDRNCQVLNLAILRRCLGQYQSYITASWPGPITHYSRYINTLFRDYIDLSLMGKFKSTITMARTLNEVPSSLLKCSRNRIQALIVIFFNLRLHKKQPYSVE